MAWAEWEFRLDRPQPENAPPLRESFRRYRQETGRKHPSDNWAYGAPKAGLHLWHWFWEISRGRQMHEATYLPLAAREINEWCAMRRIRLLDSEIDAIFRLDGKFREVMAEK